MDVTNITTFMYPEDIQAIREKIKLPIHITATYFGAPQKGLTLTELQMYEIPQAKLEMLFSYLEESRTAPPCQDIIKDIIEDSMVSSSSACRRLDLEVMHLSM